MEIISRLLELIEKIRDPLEKYGKEECLEAIIVGKSLREKSPLSSRWGNSGRVCIVKVHINDQYDEPVVESYKIWESLKYGDRVRVCLRRDKKSTSIGPSWVTHWQPKGCKRWILV